MAHIIERSNPFKLTEAKVTKVRDGITVWEWLESTRPGFVEFPQATLGYINGKAVMRRELKEHKLGKDDYVNLVAAPGWAIPVWVYWVIVIASIAYSIYTIATLPKPKVPGDTPEADPTYDLTGQANKVKLNQPVEVPYGKCRIWPSVAAKTYNKYVNNDQWQYSLYNYGNGRYQTHSVQIEDTPIENFQDVQHEIYPPGTQVTLFPDNVVTSVEVGAIELFGPNEGSYTGESGPYVANPTATRSNHLEVDVVLPNGLYLANNLGQLVTQNITASFEYREVNDSGVPVGSWHTLANFDKTLQTNTPQRFTLEADVPSGRYEVRGVRTSDKNESAQAGNTLTWVALRAFLPSTKDYGNVTLIAVKARASNNLNSNASARLNVFATRMLRTWTGTAWTEEVPTRSLVWAFCDVFQNTDYGGRIEDELMRLNELKAFDDYYESKGIYFDFIFDQRSTVWECASTIARVGRAIPLPVGNQITMVRDMPKTVPTSLFGRPNIVAGSFSHDITLAMPGDYDGVEVTFTNPDTWKQETVKCLVEDAEFGDDLGTYCEPITLAGQTNRTLAWREGMYIRRQRRYGREVVKFKADQDGDFPIFADKIGVSYDVPEWGTSGLVTEAVAVGDGTYRLQLSEDLVFTVGSYCIGFKTRKGGVSGPFVVTAGSSPSEVIVGSPVNVGGAAFSLGDFYFDEIHLVPVFHFGVVTDWTAMCTVRGVDPDSGGQVAIECLLYDERFFDSDEDEPEPPVLQSFVKGVPDLPTIDEGTLIVTPVPNTPLQALASWNLALGAKHYVVQRSYNGVDWETVGTTVSPYLQFSTLQNDSLYVRVAGINVGQGEWSNWDGSINPDTVAATVLVTLTINVSGAAFNTTTGAGTYPIGTVVNIHADLSVSGATFSTWSAGWPDSGAIQTPASNDTQVVVSKDMTISADYV